MVPHAQHMSQPKGCSRCGNRGQMPQGRVQGCKVLQGHLQQHQLLLRIDLGAAKLRRQRGRHDVHLCKEPHMGQGLGHTKCSPCLGCTAPCSALSVTLYAGVHLTIAWQPVEAS